MVLEDNDPCGYKSKKAPDAKRELGIEAMQFPRYSRTSTPSRGIEAAAAGTGQADTRVGMRVEIGQRDGRAAVRPSGQRNGRPGSQAALLTRSGTASGQARGSNGARTKLGPN